ncbi:MAG: esterase [Gammaproteobacteria bacterium]|nr:esterase [Gammaproteobacteria bacterium]
MTIANFVRQEYEFDARDGKRLRFKRFHDHSVEAEPVMLVHGAGVRSEIFIPPQPESLVHRLVNNGYDVWCLDWRASIDLPADEWTIEDAAVLDHPLAVRRICKETGVDQLKTIVHCQGSTSFMLALVAGLLPEVSLVVSNAVSLHPIVPTKSRLKGKLTIPVVSRLITYLNPQWGIHAPAGWPKVLDFLVRSIHHECNNAVCKWSSFTYGTGTPTLWRHENLNPELHRWIKGEFGPVPLSFFRHMNQCIKAGHLTTTGKYAELPRNIDARAPRTEARVVFLAGQMNNCFLAESQVRSFEWMNSYAPGKHSYYELADYGHLDVFIGKDAPRDVHPLVLDELARDT